MDPTYTGEMLRHLEKQDKLLIDSYRPMSHELHKLQMWTHGYCCSQRCRPGTSCSRNFENFNRRPCPLLLNMLDIFITVKQTSRIHAVDMKTYRKKNSGVTCILQLI